MMAGWPQVIAHTNLYWTHQTAPGRTASTVATQDVHFTAPPDAALPRELSGGPGNVDLPRRGRQAAKPPEGARAATSSEQP